MNTLLCFFNRHFFLLWRWPVKQSKVFVLYTFRRLTKNNFWNLQTEYFPLLAPVVLACSGDSSSLSVLRLRLRQLLGSCLVPHQLYNPDIVLHRYIHCIRNVINPIMHWSSMFLAQRHVHRVLNIKGLLFFCWNLKLCIKVAGPAEDQMFSAPGFWVRSKVCQSAESLFCSVSRQNFTRLFSIKLTWIQPFIAKS